MGTLMAGVILFWCAGRWDWAWGWATVFTISCMMFLEPHLCCCRKFRVARGTHGTEKGAKQWDTLIMSLVGTIILGIYIVGGLDARYGWTRNFPAWAQLVGSVSHPVRAILSCCGQSRRMLISHSSFAFRKIVDTQWQPADCIALCATQVMWERFSHM